MLNVAQGSLVSTSYLPTKEVPNNVCVAHNDFKLVLFLLGRLVFIGRCKRVLVSSGIDLIFGKGSTIKILLKRLLDSRMVGIRRCKSDAKVVEKERGRQNASRETSNGYSPSMILSVAGLLGMWWLGLREREREG